MMFKVVAVIILSALPALSLAADKVFLLSKRQIVNSTHTLVVFFYDQSVENMNGCQREIQRGYRGQWRYYYHSFPRPRGYSQKTDYHCVKASMDVDAWYDRAPYDFIYQIDIRTEQARIKPMKNYELCLRDLRRRAKDETRKFFCAKLSQNIQL